MFAGTRRALTETQYIVYRAAHPPGASRPEPPVAPNGAQATHAFQANQALLFRYSALTFNAHRIHLDRAYCREVASYPGLVVHAPLTATLLLGLIGEHWPARPVTFFRYRAVSPLFEDQRFTLNAREDTPGTLALWAAGPDGALAMTAEARFEAA